jgi:hypothetical protein
MAGTIKLPVLGETKTSYVIAGGVVVTVIVGYAYIKHARAAGSAAAPSSSSATTAAPSSTVATTTAGIDPQTGYPYGSVQDQEALESLYGGSAVDTSDLGTTGVTTTTTGTTTSASGTAPATNNAWLTNVLDTNDTGYSSAQIIQAVSAWFAGQQITTAELTVIQTVEALYGTPPQTLPPPNVSTTGTGGAGGGSGSSGSPDVVVPNVEGKRQQDAVTAIKAAGLKSHTGPGFVSDEVNYVGSQTPAAGKKVAADSTVDIGAFYHTAKK